MDPTASSLRQRPSEPPPKAVPLGLDWNPRDIPSGSTSRNVVLRTQDGAATTGALYVPGSKSNAVVCIMHPREFMANHYLVPDILEAGFAAWTQGSRSVGNDLRLEHEVALFDVAAGLCFLRNMGFEKIILLGNSGGGGLYCLYAQQCLLAPEARIARTPGGRPTDLATLQMPHVDGIVLLAPHPGQGALLLQCIDPSVADEGDPLSVIPELDPFAPANGFAESPKSSRYTAEFVQRYRRAQMDRVQRIDTAAKQAIAERLAARKRSKESGDPADLRKGSHAPIITVWRTDADLSCYDLSLDPSDRSYGSVWGSNPLTSNYGSVGFARLCSPEAWLSTWSGVSSNALLSKTAPSITLPTLMIEYTGDQSCFPSISQGIFAAIGTSDKRHERVRGDHHGRPLSPQEEPGRYIAGRIVQSWLRERY
jgi:pimeloyl-ACP methyl ester carboxylesterase